MEVKQLWTRHDDEKLGRLDSERHVRAESISEDA